MSLELALAVCAGCVAVRVLANLVSSVGSPKGAAGVRTITFLEYVETNPASLELLEHLRHAVKTLGPTQETATKSQVAFKAKKAFAWAWAPAQYLRRGAPLVLTVSLPFRDGSARWKEIVEPSPGKFTHHLELKSEADIDDQVLRWLQIARQQAD